MTERLKIRAGDGSAFWISNLKVSCFIGYVGSRTQVPLNGEKGKIMVGERRQSGGRQPHFCTHWALHSLSVAFAIVKLQKSRISVQMEAAASAYLVMAASEKEK